MRRIYLMLAGLIFLTTAIYWQSRKFELVDFDDPIYLFDNRFIKQGLTAAGLRDAFFHFRFANYAPLVSISYSLDQNLFQLKPGPMHLENAFLHLVGGLLLWRILFVFTGDPRRGFVVAALFLVDPMHVESVAWISERKDVLSTCFLFATMLAYAGYCRQGDVKRRWILYAAMLLLFAISLLTKSMGVTLPGVLLLLDYWPLKRWPEKSWYALSIEKIPMFALSIAASILGSAAQYQIGAVATVATLDIPTRIENAIVCYVLYIVKLAVPINLGVFYPHIMPMPFATVFAAAVLLAMTTWFCFRFRRRWPYAIVGWLWFLGTLLPVIGLVQVGGQAMADRYSYFPSVGLFILFVWGCGDLLNRLRWVRILPYIAGAVIITFAIICHRQVSYWKNSETLFTHTYQVAGDSRVVHLVLGQIAAQKKDIHRAVDEFNLTLKLGDAAGAYNGLGNLWLIEDPKKARDYLAQAVELDPRNVRYRLSYSEALWRSDETDEAKKQVQAVLNLDPGNPDASTQLTKISSQKFKKDENFPTTSADRS